MTATEFKAWFVGGQFNSVSDVTVALYLTRAEPWFNVTRWGNWYNEGIANWVAHSIVIDRAEATQSIDEVDADDAVSDTFGPISTTRNPGDASAKMRDPYLRTSYGQRYAYLRSLVGMGGAVVGPVT